MRHADIEVKIERAFDRLSENGGTIVRLSVGRRITPTCSRRIPLSRLDVDQVDVVDPGRLQYVAVVENRVGLCVRLVFNGRLYATSGTEAEKMKLWAERVCATSARRSVESLPDVLFENVQGQVRVHDGELHVV
jgi:hypothetical protein